MLNPTPVALGTTTWPVPADVPGLQAIVWDQMEVVAAQAAKLDGYQTVLHNAQAVAPPPVTYPAQAVLTGNASAIALSGVTGVVQIGALVQSTASSAIQPGTLITGQTSGPTGGNGNYTINVPLGGAINTGIPVTVTPQPPDQTSAWPFVNDAVDLTAIVQAQASLMRLQSSLIQQYQTLLNISDTPAPA